MKTRWLAIPLALGLASRTCSCDREPAARPTRFATFNIEDFPKHAVQIAGAFDAIAGLDASCVAVQEIVEPAVFAATARERLGVDWDVVFADTAPAGAAERPRHHLGVLFDRRVWTLLSTTVHDETRLEHRRHKPTLEVRLRAIADRTTVRVLVVHLKAGADGREIRARQYTALASIVRGARGSGDRVVVLGDFNATDDVADRGDLAELATRTGLAWATRPLECSALWDRDDGCYRSRLDHVLAWSRPALVEATGACATDGCERQDRCPLYADQVSDHCPVVVAFE